jgi:hypothetical protein
VVSASFPKTGLWYDYFSGKSFEVNNAEAKVNLLPGEFHLLTNVAWNTTNLALVPWSVPDFNILGVESESLALKVYPNPAQEYVKVEWVVEQTGETVLHLVDSLGREILQKNLMQSSGKNTHSFTTQNLTKGVYFLQINNIRAKLVVD